MRRWLKLVLVNIAVFVIIFICLELIGRAYFHFFVDGSYFLRKSSFTCPWITTYSVPPPPVMDANGDGIFQNRKEIINRKKDPNTIRIITVGGSTTLNRNAYNLAGIDYAMVLEKLLNEHTDGKTYEVLNAGGAAYSTAHSLINIQFRLVEFSPDIIVLMHNVNDRSVNYFGDNLTEDYSNKYLLSHYVNPELKPMSSLSSITYQSRILTRLRVHRFLFASKKLIFDRDINYGLEIFKRNLTYIINTCNLHNINLVLLSQPHMLQNLSRPDMLKVSSAKDEVDHIIRYNQAIWTVAQKYGVHFVDMYEKIGQTEDLFSDVVHYTPKGIESFANILYPEILNIVEAPQP